MKLTQITIQDTRYRVFFFPSVTHRSTAPTLLGNSIGMPFFRHCLNAPKRIFTLAIFPGTSVSQSAALRKNLSLRHLFEQNSYVSDSLRKAMVQLIFIHDKINGGLWPYPYMWSWQNLGVKKSRFLILFSMLIS